MDDLASVGPRGEEEWKAKERGELVFLFASTCRSQRYSRVTVGEHDTVAVRPLRVAGVGHEVAREQDVRGRRHAERCAWCQLKRRAS